MNRRNDLYGLYGGVDSCLTIVLDRPFGEMADMPVPVWFDGEVTSTTVRNAQAVKQVSSEYRKKLKSCKK